MGGCENQFRGEIIDTNFKSHLSIFDPKNNTQPIWMFVRMHVTSLHTMIHFSLAILPGHVYSSIYSHPSVDE